MPRWPAAVGSGNISMGKQAVEFSPEKSEKNMSKSAQDLNEKVEK